MKLKIVLVILTLAGGTLFYSKKDHKIKNSKDNQNDSIEIVKKATNSKPYINIKKDDKNPGKSIYSIVFVSNQKGNSRESLLKFVFNFFDENQEYSSLSAVIFEDAKDKVQYRIIIGENIAKKAKDLMNKSKMEEFVSFLKKECPTSDPRNMANFCNISNSL